MAVHLSPESLADIVETGRPDPHLDACARCRVELQQARQALTAVRADRVPEPSPLFWDHFAARVRDAVEAEAGASHVNAAVPLSADRRSRLGIATARLKLRPASLLLGWLAAVAMIVVVAVTSKPDRTQVPAAGKPLTNAASMPVAAQPAGQTERETSEPSEAAWSLVTDAGSTLDLETASRAGFDLQPGSAEQAAGQMTVDEQRELIRLLRAEVAQAE